MARFASRAAAGAELATALRAAVLNQPIVLALPTGGVPVAAAVARELGAPVDVLDVHDVTAHRADLGLGAVNAAGDHSVRPSTAAALGVSGDELQQDVHAVESRLRRVISEVRATRPQAALGDHSAIVVDDGLGVTAAAVAAAVDVKVRGAAEAIFAAPVGIAALVDDLDGLYEQVITLETAPDHLELRDWYDEFGPVDEREAVALIRSSSR